MLSLNNSSDESLFNGYYGIEQYVHNCILRLIEVIGELDKITDWQQPSDTIIEHITNFFEPSNMTQQYTEFGLKIDLKFFL